MCWNVKTFNQLTNEELYAILKLRVDVFVVEQNCPYPELDNFDQQATHLFKKEADEIIAYSRLIPRGVKFKEASIGRVITKRDQRRTGLGTELMKKSIEIINNWERANILIEAQAHLEGFYRNCGFETISEPYILDGIDHIQMIYKQ